MVKPRHPALRLAGAVTGGALIVASIPVGLLPGPGGIFIFAAGLALVLRNSRRAKVAFVRLKRRWPRASDVIDRAMRRPSARRRRERAEGLR